MPVVERAIVRAPKAVPEAEGRKIVADFFAQQPNAKITLLHRPKGERPLDLYVGSNTGVVFYANPLMEGKDDVRPFTTLREVVAIEPKEEIIPVETRVPKQAVRAA